MNQRELAISAINDLIAANNHVLHQGRSFLGPVETFANMELAFNRINKAIDSLSIFLDQEENGHAKDRNSAVDKDLYHKQKPVRRSSMDNTHQIVGTDLNGQPIKMMGTKRSLKARFERYQQQGCKVKLEEIG